MSLQSMIQHLGSASGAFLSSQILSQTDDGQPLTDQEVRALFDKARDADYDALEHAAIAAWLHENHALAAVGNPYLTAFPTGDLALLVNNASSFLPTPLASTTAAQWDALVQTNLRAAFFLVLRQARARIRDRLAWCHSRVEVMRFRGLQALTRSLAGHRPGPESAISKIIWSEYAQAYTELAIEILGPEALAPTGQADVEVGKFNLGRHHQRACLTQFISASDSSA